jgi:preprotein translocase SecE subunit
MDNRKIIVGLYLSAALIVGFLSHAALNYLYVFSYKVGRLPGIQVGKELIPVLLGIICFTILFKHPQVNLVTEEAVSELKKVTWPGKDDVVRSTYVVMFCIFIASVFLATFDLFWGKVVGFLLS